MSIPNDCIDLARWLERHRARLFWTVDLPTGGRLLAYSLPGRGPGALPCGVLVELYPPGHGWNLWTTAGEIDAAATLADADRRVAAGDQRSGGLGGRAHGELVDGGAE